MTPLYYRLIGRTVVYAAIVMLTLAASMPASDVAAKVVDQRPSNANFLAAQSDQASECDAVLQTTKTYDNTDTYTMLAVLSLINESNYEQAKHDLGLDAALPSGLFEGSYADFDEKRSTYFSMYKMSYTHSSAETHIAQYLPTDIAQKWLECKKDEFDHAGGFSVWVEKVSDSYVTIHFRWQPEGGFTGNAVTNTVNVIGASAQHGDDLKRPWTPNSERTAIFTRVPGREFILSITVADRAKEIDVGAPIAALPPALKPIQIPCGSFTSNEYVHAHEDGQQEAILNKDDSSHPVPFSYTKGGNADVISAGLVLKGTCDAVPATPIYGFMTLVLDEHFWSGGDSNHTGPCCWANAHWSPVWTAQIDLPDNGSTKPYALLTVFTNRIAPNVALANCTLAVDGVPVSLPNNTTTKASPLPLNAGGHPLRLECYRDRMDVNWDENLVLSLKVTRN